MAFLVFASGLLNTAWWTTPSAEEVVTGIWYWAYSIQLMLLARRLWSSVVSRKGIQTIFVFFVVLNIAIAVWEMSTAQHLPLSDPIRYSLTYRHLPAGLFFNTNDLGVFLAAMLPLVWVCFSQKRRRLLRLAFTVMILVVVVETGSRTALLTALGAVLLIAFVSAQQQGFLARWRTAISAFVGIGVLAVVVLLAYRYGSSSQLIVGKLSSPSLLGSRIDVWRHFVQAIADRPLGYGFGAQDLWLRDITQYTNPHSLAIEAVLTLGIPVGLVFLIYLLYTTLRGLRRAVVSNSIVSAAMAAGALLLLLVGNLGISTVMSGFSVFWITVGCCQGIADSSITMTKPSLERL
ncbi:MAG: O-antigen ligase family protein [Candidatus Cryosericum sp.]